jgi:hypothetical protein
MAKQSKATLALLARFPTFRDWMINNLTPEQVLALIEMRPSPGYYDGSHPLSGFAVAVGLCQAYRDAISFAVRGSDWATYRANARRLSGRKVYCRVWVLSAAHVIAASDSELLDLTVQRQRREIEAAAGRGRPPASLPGTAQRRTWL